MKIETYLNAMEDAGEGIELKGNWQSLSRKRGRQYKAFRARILHSCCLMETKLMLIEEELDKINPNDRASVLNGMENLVLFISAIDIEDCHET